MSETLKPPTLERSKVEGKNYYTVYMDGHVIERFKTRPPAVRLLKELEKEHERYYI